ncbi:MAG TPA: hypothetical protein VNA25_25890 [Phycisphaerae bacterium]|nr:hypothetical protein [Phycisphaerae bacterium]
MTITANFTGADKKTEMMKKLPLSAKKQLTIWSTGTVKALKEAAGAMQKAYKYPGGKKTAQLARNTSFIIESTGANGWRSTIGTGLRGSQSVRYAWIQDKGGTTHPRVTPRMRKWAWWAYSESGNEMYKGMALTKKSTLNVKVPASGWFTKTVKHREQFLREFMSDMAIMRQAEKMAKET